MNNKSPSFSLAFLIGRRRSPGLSNGHCERTRKKRDIFTFLGNGPLQTVASQRHRDRVRSCCACWHISHRFRMGKADDGLILGFHTAA